MAAPCRYFFTKAGCRKGDRCPFSHDEELECLPQVRRSIVVPTGDITTVIGTAGATIKRIRLQSGARVSTDRSAGESQPIEFEGTKAQVEAAMQMVIEVLGTDEEFKGTITARLSGAYIASGDIYIPLGVFQPPLQGSLKTGDEVHGTRSFEPKGRNKWMAQKITVIVRQGPTLAVPSARLAKGRAKPVVPLEAQMKMAIKTEIQRCGGRTQCGSLGGRLYQIPGAREEVASAGGIVKWAGCFPEFCVEHEGSGTFLMEARGVRGVKRAAQEPRAALQPRARLCGAPSSDTSTETTEEEAERLRTRAERFGVVSAPAAARASSPVRQPPWKDQLGLVDLSQVAFWKPTTANHAKLLETIASEDIWTIVNLGPPGTGKTMLAVQEGLRQLAQGKVKRMLLARPEWKARDKGKREDVLFELNRPALEAIDELLNQPRVWEKMVQSEQLLLQDFADLKGLTISDTYILIDECQNSSTEQLRLIATRPRERCKLVLTGDPYQTDRKSANWATQGLEGFARKLEPRAEAPESFPSTKARCVRFEANDVVRSEAAGEAVRIFDEMMQEGGVAPSRDPAHGLSARALASLRGEGSNANAVQPQQVAPLPTGWEEHTDEKSGLTFFFDKTTGASKWDRPMPMA